MTLVLALVSVALQVIPTKFRQLRDLSGFGNKVRWTEVEKSRDFSGSKVETNRPPYIGYLLDGIESSYGTGDCADVVRVYARKLAQQGKSLYRCYKFG